MKVTYKKYKEIENEEKSLVSEKGVSFQYQRISDISQRVSKEELKRDCFTLEKSREMLLEKILAISIAYESFYR